MTTSFIISNTSKYPKCTCTFTEYNDQLLYHDLECQSSVVELVMTFHKRPYLKLLSPEVSAKNAASLAFSLCLIMGFFFPSWCVFLCCFGCSLQGLFHLECSLLSPQVFLKCSTHFHFQTHRGQLLTRINCSTSF